MTTTHSRTHSRYVITFQRAYLGGRTVTLCEHCLARDEADPDAVGVPRLGPVSHGLHRGTCDLQLAEWDAQIGQPYADAEVRS